MALTISRSSRHRAPLEPLRDATALPSSLFYPVDCIHPPGRRHRSPCQRKMHAGKSEAAPPGDVLVFGTVTNYFWFRRGHASKLISSVVYLIVFMSDKLSKLQQALLQTQPEGIERAQFRSLMQHIDAHIAGAGPRPTGRSYRAWAAAMTTRAVLATFRPRPRLPSSVKIAGSSACCPVAEQGSGFTDALPWRSLLAGVSIAAALSMLLTRGSHR